MITNRARLNLAIALIFPGLLLLGIGRWWFAWLTQPWQFCVAALVLGAALTGLAIHVAPPDARRPRGGPMDDPDKTIVIGSANDRKLNRDNEA
jgi:hypothetical protein